ncbi:MAG: glycosyltransferase [Actinobacteria bacterium]|nr:MAG: glycosyltransferase [Actinomycetota bacterium]
MDGKENDTSRARERLYAREIDEVVGRVENLESRLREVETLSRDNASAVRTHNKRIDRLRIDKQIIGLPRWLVDRVRGSAGDEESTPRRFAPNPKRLLLIAPRYPSSEAPYAGQPVERRVRFYIEHGFEVQVYVPEPEDTGTDRRFGATVVRAPAGELYEVLGDWEPGQICWHHPLPELWPWLRSYLGRIPIHVWIHGFEAREWQELDYNYSTEEIAANSAYWDARQVDRRKLLSELFVDHRVSKIFVSQFMRDVAERFARVRASEAHIIHNVIDTDNFSYHPKSAGDRTRVVSVRSFTARNYGTDLLAGTIEALAKTDYFQDISFEIYGDGRHFEADTAFLHKFPNVTVVRRFMDPKEMAQIYGNNGVLLIPTRWDSQGMTLGEGMSSGLVPVTNRVAAIPEFVDDEAGWLAEPDDVTGLAAGISMLYENPERFEEMSRVAAKRAREQTGPESTVSREVELLKASARASTT